MPITVNYKLGHGKHWFQIQQLATFDEAWQAAYNVICKECVNKETNTIELKFRKVE
jgi:hypothetical protein